LQQGERVRGEITSSKDSKGQDEITGSRGQEARSRAKALFSSFGSFRGLAAGKRKRQLVCCPFRKQR